MSLDRNYNIKVDIRTGAVFFNQIKYYANDINVNNLIIKFTDSGDDFNLTGSTIVCNIRKPNDLKSMEQVNIVDAINGICELQFSPVTINVEGTCKAEFIISRDGDITTTDTFRFKVLRSIDSEIDGSIVDTDNYHVLVKLIDTVRDLDTDVRINEKTRQDNEQVRIDQEQARQRSIANMQNTVNSKVTEVNSAKDNMISGVNEKLAEVDTAKNTMVNDVTNKINETNATIDSFENRFNALAPDQATNAEVQLARTDAEGVTHNSLYERLLKAETQGMIYWETVEG
ncbi:BppU family phage baseplate upper protein [Romboutsia sp. 1001216sp1]|uniref:BppU family phage baseplate upper protein n=1 Tax=Romboutsia sp. 1001216sp1 TaxID=2986997 RepID=UPI00232F67E1|nr:BppU family phage baseplate upper protein [Romboutsia sp. 1001216sp1]MDB8790518.1 BppU family phage baseplate upper protein [Romboutsia sp. 1001216sp1]